MSVVLPSWVLIGKIATFCLALLAAYAGSAIVELYWPNVYEFIVEGEIFLALLWLIFGRGSQP